MSGIHVVPSDGKWRVRRAGAKKALRVFDSEGEAIFYAIDISAKIGSVLYCHDLTGRIYARRELARTS